MCVYCYKWRRFYLVELPVVIVIIQRYHIMRIDEVLIKRHDLFRGRRDGKSGGMDSPFDGESNGQSLRLYRHGAISPWSWVLDFVRIRSGGTRDTTESLISFPREINRPVALITKPRGRTSGRASSSLEFVTRFHHVDSNRCCKSTTDKVTSTFWVGILSCIFNDLIFFLIEPRRNLLPPWRSGGIH